RRQRGRRRPRAEPARALSRADGGPVTASAASDGVPTGRRRAAPEGGGTPSRGGVSRVIRAVALVLLLAACDGLGRPVVGTRPVPDGGDDRTCEVTPACVPVRSADPSSFMVPLERRTPPVRRDCDADGVDDERDNCIGVPNEEQDPRVCAAAAADCSRLLAGATNLAGADLRGCRIDALSAPAGLTLRGANLRCASLAFTMPEAAQMEALDVSQANLTGATLSFESEAAIVVDLGRSELRDTFVRASGGVRLRARESVLASSTLVLEPGGRSHDPAPALELTASDVDSVAIYEAPAAWPGRVRIERSAMRATTLDVAVLDLVGGTVLTSNVGASELFALDVELT